MHDHAWQRFLPVWYTLFYVMLVFTTVLALTEAPHSAELSVALIGLSALLGIWYSLCMLPLSQRIRDCPLVAMGYLAVGWSLWFWLTLLDSSYMFLLFGLYPQVFFFRRTPWMILDTVILTSLSLWRQILSQEGFDGSSFIIIATAIAGILITQFIEAIIRQSLERHRLLRELETTREELAIAERQAGVSEERQRLAHEIHDTLVQGFTSIVMHLEAAEGALPSDRQALQRHIDQARRTARENLVEARRLLWALQPKAFDHASLPEVLTQHTRIWSEENKIAVNATITGVARSLRPEIEVTLLRVAQEALVNAGKHAQANLVTVTLSYMEDVVVLDVQDNGKGFDPEQPIAPPCELTASGFGLKALHERIEQLNGIFTIESAPGAGTTIVASLPAINSEPFFYPEPTKEAHP